MKVRFIIVLLVLSLTSCSLLTKNGRQQSAYERYVRKSSLTRARSGSKVKFRIAESPLRQNSSPAETAPETPQSVTQSPPEPASAEASPEPQ